jgi:hypothetical protein
MVDIPPLLSDTTLLLHCEHGDARIFMLCLHFLKSSFNTHNAGCQPNSQHGIYTYQHQWRQKRALVPQLLAVTPPATDCPTVGLSRSRCRFRHATVAPPHFIGSRQNRQVCLCCASLQHVRLLTVFPVLFPFYV